MVDIHSHILPGWDDGSRSMAESLEMLQIAVDSGTTDIVATPHANSEYPFRPEVVDGLFRSLKKASVNPIRLYLGCDFHVQFDNVQDALENPAKYTINHGPYLMVELPDVMNAQTMRDILGRLRAAGITSIVTHPERNMQLQSQPGELRQWVKEGALLQVTGQSLLGRFGPGALQCAKQLLKDDLVHFIASDAHDTEDRTPRLAEAYAWMESHYSRERAERLFRLNPEAVINGADIMAGRLEPARSRKWWFFGR